MTKEPDSNETTSKTAVSKLLNDRPSDFRFHAAYLVYSEAWDKASSPEAKLKLNELIEALSAGTVDYDSFYREISQYRTVVYSERFRGGKTFIETQSKRDWRRREDRERRNARHGR